MDVIGRAFSPVAVVLEPQPTQRTALAHILSQAGALEHVQTRTSTLDTRTHDTFHVHFAQRSLPDDWRTAQVQSSTNGSPGLAPASPASAPTPASPAVAASERDELFLDSVASAIAPQIDHWLAQTQPPPPLPPTSRRRKPPPSDSETPTVERSHARQPDIEVLTPWYTALRDAVIARRVASVHDSFAWPCAAILAIDATLPDAFGALGKLWDLAAPESLHQPSAHSHRSHERSESRHEWINPDVLRFVVVVHDSSASPEGLEAARSLYERVRKSYGAHTALLDLSFQQHATAPPPVGLGVDGVAEPPQPKLSDASREAVRAFTREFVVQSLVPHLERSVVVGNEQFQSSRRSLGGRLWGAGRRYFASGSSNGNAGTGGAFQAAKGFYAWHSHEMLGRRLADLAFITRDYKLAAAVYEQVAKEFKADRAWRHYAAAVRMAGLCHLLLSPPARLLPASFNPDAALQDAAESSQPASGPTLDVDALRATLLYYDAYRSIVQDWRPAPSGLIRAAGLFEELASAILLEQAAIADLRLPKPATRKHALHMVMAAVRYERCGFKALSRRCLAQAIPAVDGSLADEAFDPLERPRSPLASWAYARSHMSYALGRQLYNVGAAEDAVTHFLALLDHQTAITANAAEADRTGARDDQGWLADLALAWSQLGLEGDSIARARGFAQLVHVLDPRSLNVSLDSQQSSTSRGSGVEEDWEQLERVATSSTSAPIVGALATTSARCEVRQDSPFYLSISAHNPLNAPVNLSEFAVELDPPQSGVAFEYPTSLELAPRSFSRLVVGCKSSQQGDVSVAAIHYRFNETVAVSQAIDGAQRPTISVRPPTPEIAVAFVGFPETMLEGEIYGEASIVITNRSAPVLTKCSVACSHPAYVSARDKRVVSTRAFPNGLAQEQALPVTLPSGGLATGASAILPVLLRGDTAGDTSLCFAFAYSHDVPEAKQQTFMHQASVALTTLPSLVLEPAIEPVMTNNEVASYELSLRLANPSFVEGVQVEGVAAVSPLWALGHPDTILAPVVSAQSSATLSLSFVPRSRPQSLEDDAGTARTVRELQVFLKNGDQGKQEPPTAQLSITEGPRPCLVDALSFGEIAAVFHSSHARQRRHTLQQLFPTLPQDVVQHVFSGFTYRRADLLIAWSIPTRGIRGYHHLVDLKLGCSENLLASALTDANAKAARALYDETKRSQLTLVSEIKRSDLGGADFPCFARVSYPHLVEHNFAHGPCIVPVSVSVCNRSTYTPMDYVLTLNASSGRRRRMPGVFVGKVQHRGRLAPLGATTIATRLCATHEGAFDAGQWKLDVVSSASSASWTQDGPEHPVRVRDAS